MAKKNEIEYQEINFTRDVKESNIFVKAQFDKEVGVIGEKLIRLAIAQCSPSQDEEFYRYHVKISDLAERLNIKSKKNSYATVKKAIDSLFDAKLIVEDKVKRETTKYHFFTTCTYKDRKGEIVLQLDGQMAPLLLGLKSNYIQYDIINILRMKYTYSPKIYELVCMHIGKTYREKMQVGKDYYITIDTDEIRKACGVVTKYKNGGDLKRYVLQRAWKDFLDFANVHVECKDVIESNKLVSLDLKVKKLEMTQDENDAILIKDIE